MRVASDCGWVTTMTESLFDPTGPNTERSGNRYTGPDAANISHMPPDVVDGVVDPDPDAPDRDRTTEEIAEAETDVEKGGPVSDKANPDH
jgi:hypothetical protein